MIDERSSSESQIARFTIRSEEHARVIYLAAVPRVLAFVASYIYINLQIGTLLLRASNVLVRGHWEFDHSPDQENSRTSSDTQEFERCGFDIETNRAPRELGGRSNRCAARKANLTGFSNHHSSDDIWTVLHRSHQITTASKPSDLSSSHKQPRGRQLLQRA